MRGFSGRNNRLRSSTKHPGKANSRQVVAVEQGFVMDGLRGMVYPM